MIHNTKIKLAIAPMAGITDKAFRQLCLKWGADISWSEMVSSEGLIRNPLKNNRSLLLAEKFGDNPARNATHSVAGGEKNYWVQIFGTSPKNMSKAANIIEKEIKPHGIDINLGCPVKKAQKAGYGACQISEITKVIEIIKEIKKNINIPLSLKTRLGLEKPREILSWAPKLEQAGIDQLVVHARTLKGMFKEDPDWKVVKELNDKLKITVIYNGGIKHPEDAIFYAKKTGCRTLMIGQAAIGRPWIFKGIKYYLKNKKEIKISNADKKSTILKHAELAHKYYNEKGILAFRTHLSHYLKGISNASELRQEAVKIKNFNDVERIIKKIKFR